MSTGDFYSSETEVLERKVEILEKVNFEELWTEANRNKCIDWIESNKFQHVCLQLPDSHLPFASKIHDSLKHLNTKLYILADTSYGSCCVDEVAASHVEADAIIHFGSACQSKTAKLSVLYIFSQKKFDFQPFYEKLNSLDASIKEKSIIVYFSQDYHYILDTNTDLVAEFKKNLASFKNIKVEKYPHLKSAKEMEEYDVKIFIGTDDQLFFNLTMTETANNWFLYDNDQLTFKEINPMTTNFLKKRYYYIEKCKDAKKIGIIVGTLSADGFMEMCQHVQQLARANGIRTYTLSIGRLNSAKLANFMELDCFVLVGCPLNTIYTSKEFYKPIVSAFEAELALNPAWLSKFPEKYVTDFNELLPNGSYYNEIDVNKIPKNDISLITGQVRNAQLNEDQETSGSSTALMDRKNYQIAEGFGKSLQDRSWQGLDPQLGLTEPAVITKGFSGNAFQYDHEND